MFHYCFSKRGWQAFRQGPSVPAGKTVTKFYTSCTAVLTLLMLFFFSAGCSGSKEIPLSNPPEDKPVRVFCTIYPLYDFAKNIGGDKIDLYCLVPPGTEPHQWEPSPKDLAQIQKADLLIYCGAGMESWIDKVLKVVAGPGLTVVEASGDIQLLSSQGNGDEPGAGPEENTETQSRTTGSGKVRELHPAADPHIWVDPVNAMKIVDSITAGLTNADPANELFYEIRAREYLNKLEALDSAFRAGLAGAPRREFVTSHAAFGYLARRYDLVQIPIRGLSPEAEPTPARMAEIIKLINKEKIRYIFFETMVSPKVSQIIADEAGVETLVLNPVGNLTTEELASGKDYLSVMRENLSNLQKALEVVEP